MKQLKRYLLLVAALAVGGGLAHKLLSNFEPVNLLLFMLCCSLFGRIFYQIDKKIMK